MKRRSLTLLVLVPLGLLAGCPPKGEAPARGTPAPAPAEVAPAGSWVAARKETLRRHVSAVGSLRARQTTRLGTQVSGRVLEVLVDVGQRVTKEQPLVRLDPLPFELEVLQRKADVAAARVAVDDAVLNLGRMQNLWHKPAGETPTISRKSVDDARARHEAALAASAQAEAALRTAEQRASESTVRAPWDGVVTSRLVDPGEPVTAAPITYVLELQDVRVLELEFALPQRLHGKVRQKTALEFEVEGVPGPARKAEVAVVYPSLDETTRTFRCRAYVDDPRGELRPGFLARVRVVEHEVPFALVVPAGAVRRTGRGLEVLVGGEGHATARAVEVGLAEGDLVQVRSGLAEGEPVLVPSGARP